MSEPVLHVQMLGGFSLQLGDEPIPPISSRPSALLAYLILHRDREHTRDLLAGRFWADSADDKARRNLSQALWRIREKTKDKVELLSGTTNTLRFNPELQAVVDIDTFEARLDEFERQVSAMAQAVRIADLGAIVDSYRGELLAGYYDDWITEERQRLRSRYRNALGRLVELASKDADYETAIRYAKALVDDEPIDEVAQRQLLRLYGMSDQAPLAERHFGQFVKFIRDQMDSAPTAETSLLMERILEDAAKMPVRFQDAERPATELVGRRTERASVLGRVIELDAGKGGVLLIEGEPGIGKSRLVEELVKGAEWRGAQVLIGCHSPTSKLTPYEGLCEALEPIATGLRRERLRDTVDPLWLKQASGVLEGLGSMVDGSEEQPRLGPADEPWRTSEALAKIILAQGRPKPTVLVLEDVHHCDEDTMSVLTQLGDRLIDHQVLVCLTYRLAEAQTNDAIWQGLSKLEAEPGSSRVVVPPLEVDELSELVAAELGPGRMSTPLIEQLARSTGGNPYLLIELLRTPMALVDAQDASRDGDTGRKLDDQLLPRVAAIIGRRIASVPDHVRSVLHAVAAVGGPSSASVVAMVAVLDRPTAVDGMQRGIDLGFLVESDRGCDFAQAQTRRVVYEALPVDERSGLHGRIVDALTLQDSSINVSQIAHHAWLAGHWQRAYQYHSLAADTALKVNAFQTAAEHFNKADNAARSAGVGDADRVGDLFEHEAVLDILGRRSSQESLLDRLATVCDATLMARLGGVSGGASSVILGEAEATARGTSLLLKHRRAWFLLHTDRPAEAVTIATEATAEARSVGRSPGDLLTVVGIALARSGNFTAAVEALTDAIEELRSDGANARRAQLMLGRTWADLRDFDAAHRHLGEAYDEAKAAGDARDQVDALGHLATMWQAQGVDASAEMSYGEAIELARAIGYRVAEGNNFLNLATLRLDGGRSGKAFALLTEAGEVFASLDNRRGVAFVRANRAWILHWIIGRDLRAARDATDAAVEFRRLGDRRLEAFCLATVADVDRRTGGRRQARRRLAHALERATNAEDPSIELQVLLSSALVDLDLGNIDDALGHIESGWSIAKTNELDRFYAALAAIEAKIRIANDETVEALELAQQVIRSNRPGAHLSHLAALWCGEVLSAAGDEEAAAEQAALAHQLLSRHVDGLTEVLAKTAWREVKEHAEILVARERYFVDRVSFEIPLETAPTGRPLEPIDFISATFMRSHPDDWDVENPTDRRRRRILRLVSDAKEQGGRVRFQDLAALLEVSERTIRRDVRQLRSDGQSLAIRRGSEDFS